HLFLYPGHSSDDSLGKTAIPGREAVLWTQVVYGFHRLCESDDGQGRWLPSPRRAPNLYSTLRAGDDSDFRSCARIFRVRPPCPPNFHRWAPASQGPGADLDGRLDWLV